MKSQDKQWHHSPDRFEPAAVKSAEPPRLEYHKDPENLNTSERPKMAGESRGKIQEGDGTGNLRADNRTKSASLPDTPGGGSKIPDGVNSYNDSGELP